MERIQWSDKPITFRSLVDDPAIKKPALVQIDSKSFVVGEKINGQFIVASPCKLANTRCNVLDQEIVLSSKHKGLWRVISKNDEFIHRLTTVDIENIYEHDQERKRATPRSYICVRPIQAFELYVHLEDTMIVDGDHIERRRVQIEANVEFRVMDIGEVEYTPSEGERTSQDYVESPKSNANVLFKFLRSNAHEPEMLIRNRLLRAIHCTTVNESRKRTFMLEVTEQPCDIYPVASEGSTELRYLHSTANLFNYLFQYGANQLLLVKLVRGDLPVKSVEFDGHMTFNSTLHGNKIPLCRVDDLEVTLVSRNLPVTVRMPVDEYSWRASSNIRRAELLCMQLTISLLARHESEIFVSIDSGKNAAHFLQTSVVQQNIAEKNESKLPPRSQAERTPEQSRKASRDRRAHTPQLSRPVSVRHPASEELYRNEERRQLASNRDRAAREVPLAHSVSTSVMNRTSSSTRTPANRRKQEQRQREHRQRAAE